MTKEDLEQLCDLRAEITELECQIVKLKDGCSRTVSDKVQASSKEYPYVQRSVKIEGYDYAGEKKIEKQLRYKRQLLQQRRDKAKEAELRIMEYINSVPDSGIRRIMEYKYIKGYTWKKIGKLLHCDRTTAEKRVSKYLKEKSLE